MLKLHGYEEGESISSRNWIYMVTKKANRLVRETGFTSLRGRGIDQFEKLDLHGYEEGESISSRNWIYMVTRKANRLVRETV